MIFERNPTGIATLRLDFDNTAAALARVGWTGDRPARAWPVGLDGVYRMSAGDYGAPLGLRGAWADARTFVVEYDGIASNDHLFLRLRFEGDRVSVRAQETAHELSVTFQGRLEPRTRRWERRAGRPNRLGPGSGPTGDTSPAAY
jgi:hypothetical protein